MKSFPLLIALCIAALFVRCTPCVPGEPKPFVVTFEDAPQSALANSIYGDNLYEESYIPYVHDPTGMTFGYAYSSFEYEGYVYSSWNGIVLSQWGDMYTEGYTNQCSVFYRDPETGFGGHGNSATFALVYLGTDAVISFEDSEKEMRFLSLFVANSTYTALSMIHGDMFCKTFSYEDKDWLKLIFTGHDKEGTITGTTDFYLADFRTPDSGGVVTSWEKVDLTSLGHVHTITFSMESSDTGAYGMNTPAYFCMDNIIVENYPL